MNNKVLTTLKSRNMVKKGDRVIVALSGGADSVALLSVMLELKAELGIEVFAAHVNHNLRGDESVRDENFVRNLCKEKGVELFYKSVDVAALSESMGEGFESVGRRVRYDFFEELCAKYDALIATAHTLSDSLETALLNIARGASLSGLSAIPYIRGKVIRPLLDVTRQEVEAYAADKSLSFVNDSTNYDADICNRNKIRHKVVPVLKDINAGTEQNFLRLKQSVSEAEDFIKTEAEKLINKAEVKSGFDAEVLKNAHPALLGYALRLIIEMSGAGFENKHIELIKLSLNNGGAVNLVGGYTAVIKQGILRITKEITEEKGVFPLEINKEFIYDGKVYSVKELTKEEIVYKKLSLKVINCDKIKLEAFFRTRRSGDRFALLKRGITKDLRKLQNELKIPAEQRDKMLLLESDGKILWSEDIGVSADGKYKEGIGILIEIREDKGYA